MFPRLSERPRACRATDRLALGSCETVGSGVVPARGAGQERTVQPRAHLMQGARSARLEGTEWLPDRTCFSASMSPGITWMWPSTRTAKRVANTPTGHAALRRRVRASRARGLCWKSVRAGGGSGPAGGGPYGGQPTPGARLRPRTRHPGQDRRLDAQVLARFAATVQPPVCHAAPMVTRRRQLLGTQAEQTGLARPPRRPGRHRCPSGLNASAPAGAADAQIARAVAGDTRPRQTRADWLQSIPGVGPVGTLLAEVPELAPSTEQVAALVGVAPFNRDMARAPLRVGCRRPRGPLRWPPSPPAVHPGLRLLSPAARRAAAQGGPHRLPRCGSATPCASKQAAWNPAMPI